MLHIQGEAALLSCPQALLLPRRVPRNVSPDALTMGVPACLRWGLGEDWYQHPGWYGHMPGFAGPCSSWGLCSLFAGWTTEKPASFSAAETRWTAPQR